MEYWVLWFFGLYITLCTSRYITSFKRTNRKDKICLQEKITCVLLVITSIVLTGGIVNAKWIGVFYDSGLDIWQYILVDISPAVCIFIILVYFLNLYKLKSIVMRCFLVFIYVVSIIVFSFLVIRYNNNIEEHISESYKVVETTNNVLKFNEDPISSNESICYEQLVLKNGNSIENKYSKNCFFYWYSDGQNVKKCGYTPTETTRVVYVDDLKEAYLEKCEHTINSYVVNRNNKKKKINNKKTIYEYTFYLPRSMKK